MSGSLTSWAIFLLLLSTVSPIKGEDKERESKSSWCLSDYKFGIVAGVGAVVAAPFALVAAGFTSAGVAAGSVAAAVQSTVYGASVGSGTVFAVLQSAGAAGIGGAAKMAIGTTVGAAATYFKSKFYSSCNSDEEKCTSNDKK